MHEVSIVENIVKISLKSAKENNLNKITKITVKIGELSGVMKESLDFAFACVSQGTIAEGAELKIDEVKATAECNDCKIKFHIDHFNKLCPKCQKFSNNILSGYELCIDTIKGD